MAEDTKTSPDQIAPEPISHAQPQEAASQKAADKKAEKKNPYKERIDLVATQIAVIFSRLEKLKRKLKESGENSDVQIVEEIAELEKQQEVLKSQKELNKIFSEAFASETLEGGKDNGHGGGTFQCKTKSQASALADSIIATYQHLGLSCNVERSEDGSRIVIKVIMPKGFEDKNPLTMSPEELLEVKEAALQEKNQKKGAENEVGEQETPSASPRPEQVSRPLSPAPMQLLPGDSSVARR